MPQQRAPRAVQAQALVALLQGDTAVNSGEAWVSTLVQRATERVLHETFAQAQVEGLGRRRSERRGAAGGDRHGDEEGTLKTAAGVLRGKVPHVRGRDTPYRSQVWATLATPSARLKTLIVERFVGGMAQRAIAAALEQALGQCVRSNSALSPMTDTLRQAYEAFRTRARQGDDVAYRCIDTGYAP